MITIGGRHELSPAVVASMHEFRHEIFARRLGWSLPMLDGVERDEYDNDDTVYFVVCDALGSVTACARLLPTVTRCMLTDLFSELLGGKPPPRDPTIWELSRFATSVRKTRDGRILSLSQPTVDLLDAVIEFVRGRGLKRLVLVTSVAIERLLIRSGFYAHRLAPPCRTTDGLLVAVFIEVDPESGITIEEQPSHSDSDSTESSSNG
jgi:acyl homoserine lactone synthase